MFKNINSMLCLWPNGKQISITEPIHFMLLQKYWLFQMKFTANIEDRIITNIVDHQVESRVQFRLCLL